MKRGLAPVVGGRVESVERPPCRLRPIAISPRFATFRRRLVGQEIVASGRTGKRVCLTISSGDRLIFEPRMTGLVLVGEPPNQEHLRLRIEISNSSATELLFWDRRGLGSVYLLSDSEFEERFSLARLGPDALAISPEDLRERLRGSRREIKVALLDQRVLAGVGNLYASEILFSAGVHPRSRCHRLNVRQWEAIHVSMLEILRAAIRYEGSTLSDGAYRNALNQEGSYQNHHRVYDREDSPCVTCAAAIVRVVQAQRATFFCPRCQSR